MKFDNAAAEKIHYNIHAKTRKFGFFGWDINIDCFYAINRNYLVVDGETSKESIETLNCINGQDATETYRIRSTELTNLFPDAGGGTLSNPTLTGRAPGYNWSQFATNEKTESFTSNPSEYTKWIQDKGYTVYSDDYLDYQVELRKEVINQLKGERDYSNFEGQVTKGSVLHYSSDLLRNGLLKNDSKVPSATALKCNNMKNYQSDECEVFNGGVE